MKKTIATIAAALCAATISASPGCSSSASQQQVQSPDSLELALDLREQSIRRALSDIADSTFCIRTYADYRRVGAHDDEPLYRRRGHGTAFAYDQRDGHTYLVTNVHVVEDDERILRISPEGVLVLYELVNQSHVLVTNGMDDTDSDDIPIEVVSLAPDIDIAVVRTPRTLPVADSYVRDPRFTPELGDEVYIVGYPQAWDLTVSRGIVSNPEHRQDDGDEYELLDSTSTFGNSGSAYFVRRGDTLYMAGVTGMVRLYGRSRVTLYAMGTPLGQFNRMLDGDGASGSADIRELIRMFDNRIDGRLQEGIREDSILEEER